ncbi:MAG TPA: type IX secretion system membrane protein PorP/SprF [Bacteroidia bacterium]|jgi:type IX secretion system PorP/SprF family membrane protein
MKKIFIMLLCMQAAVQGFAQQDAQFSHNMFNKLDFNPAFAGMTHGQCLSMIYRNQWVSFPGAPVTTLLNVNQFVPVMQGGIGFTAAEDKLGNEKNFACLLSGSRHFNIGNGELSLGGRIGWMQKSFIDNWIAPDGVPGDNSIPVGAPPLSFMDLGAGLFYLDVNENYVGVSVNHAYNNGNSTADHYFKNVPHYYLTAGTKISVPGMRSLAFKPSVLVKSDGKAMIFDVNGLLYFNDRFWGGASYRMTDAIVLMAGVVWRGVKIGYAFDYTTSELKNYSSNTHELMISYCKRLVGKKVIHGHHNPRLMNEGRINETETYIPSNCNLYNAMQGNVNFEQ